MRSVFAIGAIVIAGGRADTLWPTGDPTTRAIAEMASTGNTALAEVVVPDVLLQDTQIGERAYVANCGACNGANAAGQDGVAPPRIHRIYEPSPHGDKSFQRAAVLGVRAHHWSFGDMPAA